MSDLKPNKDVLVPPYVYLTEGADPAPLEELNRKNLAEYNRKVREKDFMENQTTSTINEIPGWYDWHPWAIETINRLGDGAVYVELGCFLGRSTTAIAKLMREAQERPPHPRLMLHAVDLFELPATADPRMLSAVPDGSRDLGKHFVANVKAAGVKKWVRMIKKPSIEAAKDYAERSAHVVFVDADHAYDSVVADILNWWPKVTLGGVMAGHDIHSFDSVWKAVHDCAAELKVPLEIIADQNIWVMRKPTGEKS